MKSYIKEFSERPSYFAERLHFERFHADAEGPVLEIGCSVGHHTQFGWEQKIGIDNDFEALRIARAKGFTVVQMDIEQGLAFDDQSISSIDCQHVIEHVQRPLFLLQECRRVLKPGGRLVIVTPNIESIGFEFYVDYTHIRPFTMEGLRRIAYDAGFSNFDVRYMYVGIPMTKFLFRRGLLSISTALRVQKAVYNLGMKSKDTLMLIAQG